MTEKQRAIVQKVGVTEPYSIWLWNGSFWKPTGLRFTGRGSAARLARKINAALAIEGKYLDPVKTVE